MQPMPKPKHAVAGAIFLMVAIASAMHAFVDDRMGDAQTSLAASAVRRAQPEAFGHDPVFGTDQRLWQIHSPVFHGLMELVLIPTEYEDLSLPFRALAGVLVLVHLSGMYAVCYRQCRSWAASTFVAILSLAVVETLGDAFSGVGSLASITPAALVQACAPLVLLGYLKYESRWNVALVFGAAGFAGNVHMSTAINLAVAMAIVFLVRHRLRLQPLGRLAAGAVMFCFAAAPYGAYFFLMRASLSGAEGASHPQAQGEFALSQLSVMYPELLEDLLDWGLMCLGLIVPIIAVLARSGRRYRGRDLAFWPTWVVSCLAVALAAQGLVQVIATSTDWLVPLVELHRASSLAMLGLYVLLAQAITSLMRMIHAHRTWVQAALVALFALWVAPSTNLRVVRYRAMELATTFMAEQDKPPAVLRHRRQADQRRQLVHIGRWARENTPADAVFITTEDGFRMLSRRAVVASRADLLNVYYLAPDRLDLWVWRARRQATLLDKPGGVRLGEIRRFADELASAKRWPIPAEHWYVLIAHDQLPAEGPPSDPVLRTDNWSVFRVD